MAVQARGVSYKGSDVCGVSRSRRSPGGSLSLRTGLTRKIVWTLSLKERFDRSAQPERINPTRPPSITPSPLRTTSARNSCKRLLLLWLDVIRRLCGIPTVGKVLHVACSRGRDARLR